MPAKKRRVDHRSNVYYPGGLDKKGYIEMLVAKYNQKFVDEGIDISDAQLRVPITHVVDLVEIAINAEDIEEDRVWEIDFLRKIVSDPNIVNKHRKLLESYHYHRTLYCYQNGMDNAPSIILERHDVPFPPEAYKGQFLCFTREMSRDVILGITATTKDAMEKISVGKPENYEASASQKNDSPRKITVFFAGTGGGDPLLKKGGNVSPSER
jgi:hypothetical protein